MKRYYKLVSILGLAMVFGILSPECTSVCAEGGEAPPQSTSPAISPSSESANPSGPANVGAQPAVPATSDHDKPGGTAQPTITHPDIRHCDQVSMRISGSMCHACLKELERRIKEINGVGDAKIDFSAPVVHAYEVISYDSVPITIYFDPDVVSLQSLRSYLLGQGYHSYKIVNKSHK